MIKRNGSVLIFSLVILSLITLLTQQLLHMVYVGSSFIQAMSDRERAEALVLGGVNIAIAQLTIVKDDQKDKKERSSLSKKDEKEEKNPLEKKLLKRLLPHLNRWQTFNLKEQIDGIDGQVKICISSEQGKININEIFDFEKQAIKKEYNALLQGLEIKGTFKPGEMAKKILDYLTKRKRKLDDVTELYEIPGFNQLSIFYSPPSEQTQEKEKFQANTALTLQDIFTTWSDNATIDPLMMSDSMLAMLGLRRPLARDAQTLKEPYKKFIDTFDLSWASNWISNWKKLEPFLGNNPKLLKNLNDIFSKEFGPKVYSVLSCGKVGNVEQRLLAVVIKEKKEEQKDKKEQQPEHAQPEKDQEKSNEKNSKKKKESKEHFRIVRVYWL